MHTKGYILPVDEPGNILLQLWVKPPEKVKMERLSFPRVKYTRIQLLVNIMNQHSDML